MVKTDLDMVFNIHNRDSTKQTTAHQLTKGNNIP